MSALGQRLREMIAMDGPISVERFMALALTDPEHGYYATRDPFGVSGDFTTAPEISQMFGELLGAWAADVWRLMGEPETVHLIELGPGRGTLMADALRVARLRKPFLQALRIHLVETSQVLAERQRQALSGVGAPVAWIKTFEEAPPGPAIVLANEFFDALPVRQYVRTREGWRERLVGLSQNSLGQDGDLTFALAGQVDPAIGFAAPEGSFFETGVAGLRLARELGLRFAQAKGAALIIDYGYARSSFGETLQALRRGAPADPLIAPGEADLTTHVDFSAVANVARSAGAHVGGPIDQGLFLERLGIVERAAQLSRSAKGRQAQAVEAARLRLTDRSAPTGMGALFKALTIYTPDLPAPAGFTTTYREDAYE